MKKVLINFTRIILPLLIMGLNVSCEDEHDYYENIDYKTDDVANVKFINTAIGPVTGTAGSSIPVNYFMNDLKVTSVGVTTGVPIGFGFGATAPNTITYAVVPSGNQTLKSVTPSTSSTSNPPVVTPETERTSEQVTTEAGKYYSCFLVGTSKTTLKNHIINDDFSVATDPAKAYIRVVNTVENTPATGYKVVITKKYVATSTKPAYSTDLLIFENISFLGGSTVFVPFEPNVSGESNTYDLKLYNGTTLLSTVSTFVPRPGRIYSIFTLGSVGLTGTTWAPRLTWYTNK